MLKLVRKNTVYQLLQQAYTTSIFQLVIRSKCFFFARSFPCRSCFPSFQCFGGQKQFDIQEHFLELYILVDPPLVMSPPLALAWKIAEFQKPVGRLTYTSCPRSAFCCSGWKPFFSSLVLQHAEFKLSSFTHCEGALRERRTPFFLIDKYTHYVITRVYDWTISALMNIQHLIPT